MDEKNLVSSAFLGGWNNVFGVFEKTIQDQAAEKQAEFADLFFLECLYRVDDTTPAAVVLTLAVKWHDSRKLSSAGNDLSSDAENLVYPFLILLRDKLNRCLETQIQIELSLTENLARSIIVMWRSVFLASYSVLHQREETKNTDTATLSPVMAEDSPVYYRWLLRMSMYYPFDADRFAVDVEKLLTAETPACVKVILSMWLVNVPRYNATQFHRQKVLNYLTEIVRVSRSTQGWMDPFFQLLSEGFMIALFRIAYINEDNSQITCSFGDFVASQMQRFFPQFANLRQKPQNTWKNDRKIRVGYVSTRFVANAVTFYMANRILQHDRNTFEIYVFAIGTQHDGMTDLLAQNCHLLTRLDNPLDYHHNAQAIVDSDLDILLFADIGMEIPTYLLAGLRLAPSQGALLGHASPTGLPTMDYFFSSEVESVHSQSHYREKLIRLPNVGSAQILPPGLQGGFPHSISRQQMGIPDDAFVFISCANGMKHVPQRDYIWVEILRRIPHAWILIKPFNPWDYDRKMVERIRLAGRRAGAPERILYVNGYDNHNEVFALLSLANAQLDTYPFNGWTTTIEAFCLALPTVTQEGNGYRSRLGAGFLRSMGIIEGIASNEDEYIQWAVKFANDPGLCSWVKNRIKMTRKNLLFDNAALQMEYEKALIEMVRE